MTGVGQKRTVWLINKSVPFFLSPFSQHIDLAWLHEAYRRTRKQGAVGIDGQSAKDYARHLDANLQGLLERAKSGTYQAPAVRRVHIPKGDGKSTRPIGIPTFEDKLPQRAVAGCWSWTYGRTSTRLTMLCCGDSCSNG